MTSVLDGGGGQADISIPSFDSISWRRILARRGTVGGGAGCIFWRVEDVTGAREIESIRRLEDARLIDYIDYLPVGFLGRCRGRHSLRQPNPGAMVGAAAGPVDWNAVFRLRGRRR